jgi:hypothetical protein
MAWFSDGGKQHMHKYFIMCSRCGGKRDIYHYGIIWSLCGGQQHIGHFYVEVNNTSAIFMWRSTTHRPFLCGGQQHIGHFYGFSLFCCWTQRSIHVHDLVFMLSQITRRIN